MQDIINKNLIKLDVQNNSKEEMINKLLEVSDKQELKKLLGCNLV